MTFAQKNLMTTLRSTLFALFGLLMLCVASYAPSALAQDSTEPQVGGPLAHQPAGRRMRIYREGRFNLQPFVGFTIQDEFSRSLLVGGQLNYHFTDWLGLGVVGFGSAQFDTDLTSQVRAQGQTTDRNRLSLPTREKFNEQIGRFDWGLFLQLNFVPLRGKLALFQEVFLDADFYVFLGLGVVSVTERAEVRFAEEQWGPVRQPASSSICNPGITDVPGPRNATGRTECNATQSARASRVAFAPTFGVGLTIYANSWFGLAVEYRAMPFAWNTGGFDTAGANNSEPPPGVPPATHRVSGGNFPDGRVNSSDQQFFFNHTITVGASFYLPTDVRVTE